MLGQRERLDRSKAGRRVLADLNFPIRPHYCEEDLVSVPETLREQLIVSPIPRNMSPLYHGARRAARARQLTKKFSGHRDVIYTDVAKSHHGHVLTAVNYSTHSNIKISASVRTHCTSTAEATAIALAIRQADASGNSIAVLTDSQAACRMFINGRLPRITLKLLGETLRASHGITWCPGHSGVPGNERANALARELANRADDAPSKIPKDHTPHDILEHQRRERQIYAFPHPQLGVGDARKYRKIQTHTFPHLGLWHAMWPAVYAGQCPWCGGRPSLPHIMWECICRPPNINSPLILTSLREPWEAVLARADLEIQKGLLDQAERTATATGVLD